MQITDNLYASYLWSRDTVNKNLDNFYIAISR